MIDKSKLYRFPWTRENNPNAWIEPTTHCQLKCPFCYRGIDRERHSPFHMDVADVKKDIDTLIELRNPITISIAGGEPLLYPHLEEIIDYIRARKVRIILFTNGLLLDETMLKRLREKRVSLIVLHIDKYQERDGITTEEQANRLRQKMCDLFRKVRGVSLGFIQPLGLEDLDDLDVLLPFFKENVDIVDVVTFNRMQHLDLEESSDYQVRTWEAMVERVQNIYGLEYGAYLEKTHTEDISWLFGQAVFSGNSLLGSPDKNAFRFFREKQSRGILTLKALLYLPFNKSMRRMFYRYARLDTRGKLHFQLVLLVNTPRKLADGSIDRCKGCPDAMLYGGKLVPSCALELVKEGLDLEAG